MTRRTTHCAISASTFLALAACAAFVTLPGCGGGASEQPTVVIKSRGTQPDSPGQQPAAAPSQTDNSAAAPASAGGGFGHWTGRVVFEGAVPQLQPKVRKGDATVKDAAVCAAMDVPDERFVVKDGGVANVFIYMERAPRGVEVPPSPAEPVVLDQRGCRFLPHALILRVNQPLKILSDDPIPHNTHVFTKRNTEENKVVAANDRNGIVVSFARFESAPASVKCDFHAWMQAYLLPLEHPYAAVSSPEDGTFEIRDIPAGTHEFRVWHEGAGPAGGYVVQNLKVTIQAGQTTQQDITYPAGLFVAGAAAENQGITLSSLIQK